MHHASLRFDGNQLLAVHDQGDKTEDQDQQAQWEDRGACHTGKTAGGLFFN